MRTSVLLVALVLCLLTSPALADSSQSSRALLTDSTCESGWSKKTPCAPKDGMWQCSKKNKMYKECKEVGTSKEYCCNGRLKPMPMPAAAPMPAMTKSPKP